MNDDGHEAFVSISASVFRLTIESSSETRLATAFAMADLVRSERVILATAAHVVHDLPNEKLRWQLERYDRDGTVTHRVVFTAAPDDKQRPYVWNKTIDIAFVIPPQVDENGNAVTVPRENPIAVIPKDRRITEGTRVGWAGFPNQVAQFLGRPRLCYFEGVVSAFHADMENPLYIVDGHNARGVSGGPVWHWPTDRSGIELVGVVAGYAGCKEFDPDKLDLPGFCYFIPINVLVTFLQSAYSGAKSG